MTEKRQILQSASVITLATLISRICGYLRDQRLLLLLGSSLAADSFVIAFRIPNLVRRLVGEGALASAFVPIFTDCLHNSPRAEAWRFAQRLFWTLALLLAGLTLLGVIFSSQLINLLTTLGGTKTHWELAVYLNRIIFPYVFFIGLAALGMAILNSLHIFGLPASTPIVFNLVLIVFSFGVVYRPVLRWAPPQFHTPAVALAIGVLIGGLGQFLMLMPALARQGMRFGFAASLADPGVREVGRLMLPAFFGTGLYQINFFVDTIFATASRMPPGSPTSLYVADRVMELVLGSYAIAISTAILPLMSRHAASGLYDTMKQTFGFSLRLVSFITLPAAVGLILFREPIIRVLFQHGAFGAESTRLTAHALLFYALGLPAFAAVKLVAPVFYSLRDTRTPVFVASWAMLCNVGLNVVFLFLFFPLLQNGSPALASSVSAYVNFSALFVIFRKRLGRLDGRRILASLFRIAGSTAVMGLGCYSMLRWVRFEAVHHFLAQVGILLGMIGVSVGLYFAMAKVLGCEEVPELVSIFERGETTTA